MRVSPLLRQAISGGAHAQLARELEDVVVVDSSCRDGAGLESVLREGLPQEKLVTLRQCIQRITISKLENSLRILFRLVPAGNLENTQEFACIIGAVI